MDILVVPFTLWGPFKERGERGGNGVKTLDETLGKICKSMKMLTRLRVLATLVSSMAIPPWPVRYLRNNTARTWNSYFSPYT